MTGQTNSGFCLPVNGLPTLIYIWAAQGTPSVSYTHTVSDPGYYLGISMRGDSSGTCTTTGANYQFISQGARRLMISQFLCEVGDTITVGANNYSGNTNCRAEAALFKISCRVKVLSTVQNVGVNDSSGTYAYTFTPGKYLLVYGMQGNTSNYTTVASRADVSPSGTALSYDIQEWKSSSSGLNFDVVFIEVHTGNLKITNAGNCGTAGGMNQVVFALE